MIDDEEHTRALTLIGVYCGITTSLLHAIEAMPESASAVWAKRKHPFADASGFTGLDLAISWLVSRP
ncbi:hypothetical protein CFAM422_007564 [Trichoderma lentiforme]|uniref:Uncharacterized protein n=1 Tax=Trichoderma lentiforme TaxID=1567552 RepID=A0A9P4XDF3_9HYPO|nr:hypothetical protein CFAM422_007564 [Trichoderma lentiforme]